MAQKVYILINLWKYYQFKFLELLNDVLEIEIDETNRQPEETVDSLLDTVPLSGNEEEEINEIDVILDTVLQRMRTLHESTEIQHNSVNDVVKAFWARDGIQKESKDMRRRNLIMKVGAMMRFLDYWPSH